MTSPCKPRRPALPDTVAFLDDTFGNEADWHELVGRAQVNRDVAHALYDVRTAHHLTQRELAELIGTKQPVIARLEDADYEGHSMSMLNRIAAVLNRRVKIEFVPLANAASRSGGRHRGATLPKVIAAAHGPQLSAGRHGRRNPANAVSTPRSKATMSGRRKAR